jgi:hypothetical protein
LTTIAVPEGESARVQSPDGEGFLTLTVTSLTTKNQSAGEGAAILMTKFSDSPGKSKHTLGKSWYTTEEQIAEGG